MTIVRVVRHGIQSAGGFDFAADFVARATASSQVRYGINFADVYINGTKNTARSGIATSQDLRDEALELPGDSSFVNLDTSIKLSGNSCVITTLPTTDRTEGSWAFTPNGVDTTLMTEFYGQISIYLPRSTIAYRWLDNGDSFQKFVNFGQLGAGEICVGYDRFCGFFCLLVNGQNTLGITKYLVSSGANPWGTATARENPALGADVTLTSSNTRQQWLNTYGPLPRALILDTVGNETDYNYNASDPYLDTRTGNLFGWPDSRALVSGAVPWQKDGWTTFEVHAKYVAGGVGSTLRLWAAPYGSAPVLLINEVGTWDFGTTNTVPTGNNAWDHFELLNYATGRQPEAGRPTQSTYYGEVLVSEVAINFPGGYALPSS